MAFECEVVVRNVLYTCVSVSRSCFASAVLFATDKYFPRSNSVSKALICDAENAVRGRFFRSSFCARNKIQFNDSFQKFFDDVNS